MYLSDLVSSLLSIAAPSEPLAMSVSPPDDAELESSRVADDAARASIFTSEKFWPIFLNHLKKMGGSMNLAGAGGFFKGIFYGGRPHIF